MRDDLEAWRTSLPIYMRLEALVQSPEISPDQRRVTFYMHLFYMGGFILLQGFRDSIGDPQRDSRSTHFGSASGTDI
uniref:WGS project CBMG000000000 data, contig CS5907-c000909 n=1 Tax=Fusarium acuminatum CS5907 TaxID=1318461 RepID=A0A096PER1_9HYPO|nr:unnamed protein product [Fusarium acuminatum CS5907]